MRGLWFVQTFFQLEREARKLCTCILAASCWDRTSPTPEASTSTLDQGGSCSKTLLQAVESFLSCGVSLETLGEVRFVRGEETLQESRVNL